MLDFALKWFDVGCYGLSMNVVKYSGQFVDCKFDYFRHEKCISFSSISMRSKA